jgi:hypothetical protein
MHTSFSISFYIHDPDDGSADVMYFFDYADLAVGVGN